MRNGYGVINLGSGLGNEYVHRFAWKNFIGPIPKGFDVGHICHDQDFAKGLCAGGPSCWHRLCCNPFDCLTLQTRATNLAGGAGHGNETHCPHRHPYSGKNLFVTKDGHRQCKICKRAADRRWRAKRFGYAE